jgi:hypothetical protein
MNVNAPEKLYLSKNIYSTHLYQVPDPDDNTAVEYVQANALIEKAEDWLRKTQKGYVLHDEDIEEFVCDMKNEGEIRSTCYAQRQKDKQI